MSPARVYPDFYRTGAAAPVRFKMGVVAEGGDVNLRRPGGLQHGHTPGGFNLVTVDGYSYLFYAVFAYSGSWLSPFTVFQPSPAPARWEPLSPHRRP